MTLPDVSGWLIDYRTARGIFDSASNERISHCVERCAEGKLHICHEEREQFKRSPGLKTVFLDDHDCVLMPDGQVMDLALKISKTDLAKTRLRGNQSAVFLPAFASAKKFGVITNHRSFIYATAYDLCCAYGIPVFSADEYFAAL